MIRSYQGKLPIIGEAAISIPPHRSSATSMLGEQASIWMNAVVRGDVNSIRIGAEAMCKTAQCCTECATSIPSSSARW